MRLLQSKDFLIALATLSVFVDACIYDSDCAYYKPNANCVWFFCRPPACRSDIDCVNWGYTSHFCLNTVATFFGTYCVVKREKDAVCYGNNSCISNKCIWIFGFLGLEGFGYCA